MQKIYVLDTSVLLHNADSIFKFEDNEVVIPIPVVEQIDNSKKGYSEVARNARKVSRIIADIMERGGDIANGAKIPNGGTVRVELNNTKVDKGNIPVHLADRFDDRILAIVYNLHFANPDKHVILVSKDINMRIIANALNIKSEDFRNDKIDIDSFYTGTAVFENVPVEMINRLYASRSRSMSSAELSTEYDIPDLYENQFVMMSTYSNSQSALCRFKDNLFVLIGHNKTEYWGVQPLNKEQIFAMDLLLDDTIRCVSLLGIAGTGKTLISLAAALHKAVDEELYKRILVARPTVEDGTPLGALPGSLREKLDPWMGPIYDNFDYLFENGSGSTSFQYLEDQKRIQVQALQLIRGRTLPFQWFLLDEAQNTTQKQMKTLVTRMGRNSKLVLTGDPDQIDHPYLDASSNGLSYLVERFKGEKMYGHVTLTRCERDPLAELGAKLL
jgi:PhoH-like ATPase